MRDAERFWSKVRKDGGCWPWTASIGTHGYGSFWLDGRNVNAHHAAWILTVGPVPQGMLVCHTCDNPPCCNPGHLYLGTPADNMRDKYERHRTPLGERHHAAKLTDAQAYEVRERWIAGERQSAIAARFGITQAGVSRIVLGRSRKREPMPPGTRIERGVKLTPADVRTIRALHPGLSYRLIGFRYGIQANMVARIVTRKAWKHIE